MDDRQALLAAILASPDDDLPRLVFADWLDENGEFQAASRQRWWCPVRARLRDGIRLEGGSGLHSLGETLSRADGWRWRLGSLAAIWTAERYFTPDLDPSSWPAGWSGGRFLSVLHESRSTIEAVALEALPPIRMTLARQLADQAAGAARGLVEACPQGFDQPLGPWVQACEVLHMAERTVAVTKDWPVWEDEMRGEGGIAGELMAATASAFEILLAEPLPQAGN